MLRASILTAGLLLVAGCGGDKKTGDIPKTYPVTGKVLDPKGKPLAGGSVQFNPGKAVDLTVVGVVGPDGTFTVKTFRDKDQAVGAPEGEYEVTVAQPIGSDNQPPPPITLGKKFKVEAKENTLDIDLRKP